MTEETPKRFSLRLSGDGINIEQEIDQRTAAQIVQIAIGGGAPTNYPGPSLESARPVERATLSLREYLDEVGAKKKPDQITTIAQYVCEFEGQSDFGRDDIRSRFIAAREPAPGNFPRDFAIAERSGWIAEVHGKKGRYYVTTKGAQAIGSNFGGKGAVRR